MQAAAPEKETERLRRQVAALQAQLTEMEFALDAVPVLISYIDRDHRYIRVNRAYEDMFDLRRQTIVGRTVQEVTGEPHYSNAKPYIARALAGERVSFESRILHKDGTLHELELTYSPHFIDNAVEGVVIFVRDLTEEKRARAALREREQDLISVLNNVPDVISRYTPDLRVVFTSAAIERHTGLKPEFFVGKTHAEMGYPDDLARRFDEGLRQIFATGVGVTLRFEFEGPRGLRQYEVTGAPEFDSDGFVRSVLTITHDITNRLRAEDELRRSEERQRLAVEAGKVGLWHWDIAANRVDWSDLQYDLHGLEHGSFDGTVEGFVALVHPDDRDSVSRALARALDGEAPYHVEFRCIGNDGVQRWILTNGRVVFENSRPVRMLGATIDVSESKAAAEALSRANEELRRANEDLNQFAYAASHDLKEPLRMVSLYTQFLKRRYAEILDGEGICYIGYAVDGARRMERLVSDLLEYTQAINPESENSVLTVDVNAAMAVAVSNLGASIEECHGTVTQDDLPVVRWREGSVVQVLHHLIDNALKYRRPDEPPRIHVCAQRSAKLWTFSVRDNGIGVDEKYHQRIFGIFKRLHNSDKYEGTGIGLAICQKLVERNGGNIWLTSKPGEGSTFYFTCPA